METAPYRAKLEGEKRSLEREMEGVGKKSASVPNDFEARPTQTGIEPDLVDQADTIRSFEENEGILHDLEPRYDHILAALDRIEKGTYGKCEVCGKEIEKDRLDADPAAATCVAHLQ